MTLEIVPIRCLNDNYAYRLRCLTTGAIGIVDPSESIPILNALNDVARLDAIFNTHHHFDHVGGNEELLLRYPQAKVYGHHSDRLRIPGQSEFLEHQDAFLLGAQSCRVLHIPGHTLGAIAYVFGDHVFTGDTLFGGGCGRLFEGTPAMMYHSLNVTLGALPDSSLMYCGHEYTERNLEFAVQFEPRNSQLRNRLAQVSITRSMGRNTVPSTLELERQTNPFLRVSSRELQESLRSNHQLDTSDPIEVFTAIRRLKDAA